MAELLRLSTGYIYPKAERSLRDLLRKRSQLVQIRTQNILSMQNIFLRQTGKQITGGSILKLNADNLGLCISDLNAKHAALSNLNVINTLNQEINNKVWNIKTNAQKVGLKKAMVTKLLQPGGPSVLELSKKQGLSKTTIYNWIKKYGVIGDNSIMAANTTINKSSSDYQSASSKLKAIIDTENLTEEEIGTYCRQKGVYYSELQAWKQTFIDYFDSSNTKTSNKEYRQKYFNLEKENK